MMCAMPTDDVIPAVMPGSRPSHHSGPGYVANHAARDFELDKPLKDAAARWLNLVPAGHRHDARESAKDALETLREYTRSCPGHPLGALWVAHRHLRDPVPAVRIASLVLASEALWWLGYFEDARRAAQAAADADPASAQALWRLAVALYRQGRFADAGERLRCETSTWSGDVTSATSAGNLVVHFLGCTDTTAEGEKCSVKSTNTTVAGLILINTSRAVLGLVLPKPVSRSDVGLLVLPASGRVFTTLVGSGKCVETTKVSGSVAGLAEPVGSLQTTGKVVFAQTGGKQDIADLDLSTGGLVAPELIAFAATVVGKEPRSLA